MKNMFLRSKCIIIFFMILLTGCGKTTAGSAGEGEQITLKKSILGCYSESGILYETDGILHFVDYGTGEDIVLCTKPNCTHRPYSAVDNPDPYCDAALPWDDFQEVLLYGDKLYAFITDFDTTEVYSKGVSGGEWKKLSEIPYGYEGAVDWIVYRDTVYYVGRQYTHEEGTLELNSVPFLAWVKLTDGSYGGVSEIDPEANTVMPEYVDGEYLYYSVTYELAQGADDWITDVFRVNLETFFAEQIFEERDKKSFAAIYDGCLYYVENGDLYRVNSEGGTECLYNGSEVYASPNVTGSGFTLSYGHQDTGEVTIVYYDFEKQSLTELDRPKGEGTVLGFVGDYVLISVDPTRVMLTKDYLSGKENYMAEYWLQ